MALDWDVVRAKFITSAVKVDQHPDGNFIEIAFAGRSNVGKSSIINSVCRQNKIAKVSSTPGKTQTINFYELHAKASLEGVEQRRDFFLVDLPGYGFARASHTAKDQWSAFIRQYISSSDSLKLVCQLIDIRHDLMESDRNCYHWLTSLGLPVQIVLTKADKLSKQAMQAQHVALSKALGLSTEDVIVYSVPQRQGRLELIERMSKYFF